MGWTKFFDRIVLINLPTRNDRLVKSLNELDAYKIPFELFEAIKLENGAEGLRDTMLKLFKECIDNNVQNLLVFEDDIDIIDPSINEVMNEVIKQLPSNYDLLYLGVQPSKGFTNFYSKNLLPIYGGYGTHAVGYSLNAMKFCVYCSMGYPIDNWMVDELQIRGNSYCTYPMLCSQKEDVSDIGGLWISWKPFLEKKYNQEVNKLNRI
jgi:GR25 family glycosyltransferase involved in LPS biosynthesis